MFFVAFPDNGVLGLRHEPVALLPRHRCEAAAFLAADLVEDNLGELAFRSTPCGFGSNSGRSLGRGFPLFSGCRGLRSRCEALIASLGVRCFLLVLHGSVPPLDWAATIRVSREKASANLVGTSVRCGSGYRSKCSCESYVGAGARQLVRSDLGVRRVRV